MNIRYYYELTVTGHGKFPLDMLRYARAFPVTEADSATMETPESREDYRAKRSVRVGFHANTAITADNVLRRFESFGWKAQVTFEDYLGRR